jgi:hypothetical protein
MRTGQAEHASVLLPLSGIDAESEHRAERIGYRDIGCYPHCKVINLIVRHISGDKALQYTRIVLVLH